MLSIVSKARLATHSKWKLRGVSQVGSRPRVLGTIRVDNRGRIVIGDRFMGGGRLVPFELVTRPEAFLSIGHQTYIHDGASIAAYGQITIGDRVLIGRDVLISDCDQHGHAVSQRKEIPPFESVHIGDDVWLGDRVTVLKGVRIGKGSIIAAGSVVTKPVPAMEKWAGVPARKIGEVEG